MYHNLHERNIDLDFTGLSERLIKLFTDGLPLVKEIFLVVFDDGQEMEVTGSDIAVSGQEVHNKYVELGYDTKYGLGDSSKFGQVNYTRVKYVAHRHVAVSSPNQSRPSGKDTTDGHDADYELTKLFMGIPHYVVSGKYFHCMNFSKDDRVVSGSGGIQIDVSWYGTWEWGKVFPVTIEQIERTEKVTYIADEHFNPDFPDGQFGGVILEDNTKNKDDVPTGNLNTEVATVNMYQDGSIELISNWTENG